MLLSTIIIIIFLISMLQLDDFPLLYFPFIFNIWQTPFVYSVRCSRPPRSFGSTFLSTPIHHYKWIRANNSYNSFAGFMLSLQRISLLIIIIFVFTFHISHFIRNTYGKKASQKHRTCPIHFHRNLKQLIKKLNSFPFFGFHLILHSIAWTLLFFSSNFSHVHILFSIPLNC